MKEIDIIKHAKSYMEMLSKGINPISKEKYANNSDINNPRLIKCFEFVSETLAKVIKDEEEKENSKKDTADVVAVEDGAFVNTLVSDDVQGEDVVNLLISKGVLNQGFSKKATSQNRGDKNE